MDYGQKLVRSDGKEMDTDVFAWGRKRVYYNLVIMVLEHWYTEFEDIFELDHKVAVKNLLNVLNNELFDTDITSEENFAKHLQNLEEISKIELTRNDKFAKSFFINRITFAKLEYLTILTLLCKGAICGSHFFAYSDLDMMIKELLTGLENVKNYLNTNEWKKYIRPS